MPPRSTAVALVLLAAAAPCAPAQPLITVPDDRTDAVLWIDSASGDVRRSFPLSDGAAATAPLDSRRLAPIRIASVTHPAAIVVSDPRNRRLSAIHPDTGEPLGIIADNIDARGLALAPTGELWIAAGRGGVARFDPRSGTLSTVVPANPRQGPNQAVGILHRPPGVVPENLNDDPEDDLPEGDILVTDVTLDAIWRFSPAGARIGAFSRDSSLVYPQQLALRDDGRIVVCDTFADKVREFTPTGDILASYAILRPRGVIERADGALIVSAEPGILALRPDGAIERILTPGYPAGAPRFLSNAGCTALVGDLDGDGRVTNFDVDAFVLALVDAAEFALTYPDVDRLCAGDINRDGRFDLFDIDPFVSCLVELPEIGRPCP
ncbi:MAG: hypothetical protein HRU75_00165 [Planctomycetia bacterium]|nr:MAG: hypothetical protein HRU75_00165 [Planctomycetia bacterium]